MHAHPHKSEGTLSKLGDEWIIRLDTGTPMYSDGERVDLLFWSSSDDNSKNEIQRIADTQQLQPEIVVLALASEGKFA